MMFNTLALRFGFVTAVLALVDPVRASAVSQQEVREAVTKGLALVQKAARNYPTHRDCFSCHHQTLPMLATARAADVGVGSDATLIQDQADFVLESFLTKRKSMKSGKGVGGGAITVGYALWALDVAGRKPDETTDAMVSYLLKSQAEDGRWRTGGRPPLEESAVTTTVLSAAGLSQYARGADEKPAEDAIKKALTWLEHAPRSVQEDYSSRLWGLVLLGGGDEAVARARDDVTARQNADGGWSSADGLPSDAYASGQALVRLRESGLAADSSAYERGVRYLLQSQKPDGSWRLETRSRPVQEYFDNGDPHGKHQFISTPATCWAVAALAAALAPAPAAVEAAAEPVDLLIRGGTIVDGTGNPAYRGDLAVRGDRIAAVGRIPEDAPARRVIDARGLVVAPGFIDMHSHSDMTLLEDGAAMSKVAQGVTTEVLGEDSSAGPSLGKLPPKTVEVGGETLRWTTLGGYFDALEQRGIAVNVASYVGLGTLLDCVKGDALDRPTAEELAEVKTLLDAAMGEGAFGLSTMLAGPRELAVATDDLVALAEVVRRRGGVYSSHIRNEGTEVLAAIDEAIAVGERAGVPVDVLHIKIADQVLWGKMDRIVAKIDDARRRGVNVQANIYPYTRGNNNLVTIIPPWAHEGGKAALLARLQDPSQRARLKAEIRDGLPGWYDHYKAIGGDWSRMLISAKLSPKNAAFEGKTMDVVLAARAKPDEPKADPLDLFLDFLVEEGGSVSTIYAHHTEEDMNLALRQPWCSIGSDGSALAVEGSLRRGSPHPRSFGTFPRVLGVYVRERRLLTIEDAVRKMTSLSAAKLGVQDRGLLRAGMFADVTVFDPGTIVDKSTYLDPFQYNEGVVHVLVNGRPVFEKGKATGERPGRVVRHKG